MGSSRCLGRIGRFDRLKSGLIDHEAKLLLSPYFETQRLSTSMGWQAICSLRSFLMRVAKAYGEDALKVVDGLTLMCRRTNSPNIAECR